MKSKIEPLPKIYDNNKFVLPYSRSTMYRIGIRKPTFINTAGESWYLQRKNLSEYEK